jgi:hypothetical protein
MSIVLPAAGALVVVLIGVGIFVRLRGGRVGVWIG